MTTSAWLFAIVPFLGFLDDRPQHPHTPEWEPHPFWENTLRNAATIMELTWFTVLISVIGILSVSLANYPNGVPDSHYWLWEMLTLAGVLFALAALIWAFCFIKCDEHLEKLLTIRGFFRWGGACILKHVAHNTPTQPRP